MSTPRGRHPNQRPLHTLPPELRRTTVPPSVRTWVRRALGAEVRRVRRLTGASSTAVHRLDLADGRAVALRRYLWRGFLDAEPDAPQRELDALRFATDEGLAAPRVLAADPDGSSIGDAVPAIVMTFLPGVPQARPDPHRLAEAAAAIHAVDPTGLGHDYFPWYEAEMTTPPPLATRPALWEEAIAIWQHQVPAYEAVLIHRDFHPGNVQWSRRRVTGVVDWVGACRGPAGCDVATCWSNLVDWADRGLADAFVSAYRSITGEALQPFWKLANLLEAGPRHWTPANLAKGEPELARLVRQLR